MKKSLREIKIISAMVFLYPLFALAQYVLLSEEKMSFDLFWIAWFLLFCDLGYGIYKRDHKRRLAVIILFTVFSVGPLIAVILAAIITPFMNFELFQGALETHGLYTVVWMPLINFTYIFIPNILYLAFVIYKLTRPGIKEYFHK